MSSGFLRANPQALERAVYVPFSLRCVAMAPRRLYNILIDADLAAALKQVKKDTGIPESEQVPRAIREWMERRRMIAKTNRKRGPARKQEPTLLQRGTNDDNGSRVRRPVQCRT